MYANYHTHTPLCRHASGLPRDYVEVAVSRGLSILGFSDHVPYPFSRRDYNSGFRMTLLETELYYNALASLREEYKDKITILIGYEAEYYPKEFSSMLANISRFECDYLILGQHCFNNEYDGGGVNALTDDETILIKYVDQVVEGINTGKFSYIAHPDMMNFRGDLKIYREQMSRICTAAKAHSMPLELNMLGLMDNRHYPYEPMWELVHDMGNDVILGCDAHSPLAVADPDTEAMALAYARKFGITPINTLELKKIN